MAQHQARLQRPPCPQLGARGAPNSRVHRPVYRAPASTHLQRRPGNSGLSPAVNQPAIQRAMVQRTVDYDNCTPAEEAIVLASHRRAIDMVNNAIAKLWPYTGAAPVDVRTALDRHFHASSVALAKWIAANLQFLVTQSRSPTYECRKPQVGSLLGWAMWCVPFTDIELYPNWFAEPDIDKRASTMIHEWVHRYGCNFDLGYAWEADYPRHGTLRSLLNADPWAELVFDVR